MEYNSGTFVYLKLISLCKRYSDELILEGLRWVLKGQSNIMAPNV